MHNTNFISESRLKIIQVNSVAENNGTIYATITTKQFGRVTIKPYEFDLLEWPDVLERGWTE